MRKFAMVVLACFLLVGTAEGQSKYKKKPSSSQTKSVYNNKGRLESTFRKTPTGYTQRDSKNLITKKYVKTPTGYNVYNKNGTISGRIRD
jgi:hypothetical protein